MLCRHPGDRRLTMPPEKNYDQQRLVDGARQANVTPYAAQNTGPQRSRIAGRTTRHADYEHFTNAPRL